MDKQAKIYVAGSNGMVGSSIVRKLRDMGYEHLILKSSRELDLREQTHVRNFFQQEKPEYVFMAAAKVGGIYANNTYPAEFLYDNLMIEANIIQSSYENKVKKMLFLGSSCIYPKLAPQPLKEEYLLTGSLEPTNEAYAIAKITGIELCKFYKRQYECNFVSAMPTNLYGPNDNYDLNNSHVLPALIRKFLVAKEKGEKEVIMWGTGSPLREFLHVDDLADACLFLMDKYDEDTHINVGSGEEISIKHLAELISDIVGYEGEIVHDMSKPDGTPRKLMDNSKINNLGWTSKISLREGITSVVNSLDVNTFL